MSAIGFDGLDGLEVDGEDAVEGDDASLELDVTKPFVRAKQNGNY